MTYAALSGSVPASGGAAGMASMRARSASMHTARPAGSSPRSRTEAWVTNTSIPASSAMKAMRSAGCTGSSATTAPPARRIPSSPASISGERSMHSPTRDSGRTPSPRSRFASRPESASSSA